MSISPGELLADQDSAEELFIDECDVEVDSNYGVEISPGRRAAPSWSAHLDDLRCRFYYGRDALARDANSDRETSTYEIAIPLSAGAISPRQYRIAEVRDANGNVITSETLTITSSIPVGGFRHLIVEEVR